MIVRPDDNMNLNKDADVKKRQVIIPTDNTPARIAKDTLERHAGVNVIEQKKIEKKHVITVCIAAAFMSVCLIISGVVGSTRANAIDALSKQVTNLQNQITMMNVTEESVAKSSDVASYVGLSQTQLEHDSEIIEQSLHSMLGWSTGGMDVVRDSVHGMYDLSGNTNLLSAFYPKNADASRFDNVTIYCRKPSENARSYACDIEWMITTSDGENIYKTALFVCTVGKDDRLSAMNVWMVSDSSLQDMNVIQNYDVFMNEQGSGMSEVNISEEGMSE